MASHVVGLRMRAMIDAYNSGRDKEAADLHLEMLPLFKNLFITSNPVPVKTALKYAGITPGTSATSLSVCNGRRGCHYQPNTAELEFGLVRREGSNPNIG